MGLYKSPKDYINRNFKKYKKNLVNYSEKSENLKKDSDKFEKQMIKGGYTGDFN